MRFLFTTLQTYESEFYGRVGMELSRRGHDVTQVAVSRYSVRELRSNDVKAHCLRDVIAFLGEPSSLNEEVRRIESAYAVLHIRDVYYADRVCRGAPEDFCLRRTVDYFRALEHLFDEVRPDVVVPEVGNELIRVVSHLIARQRDIPVLFLLYTIFPNPLRLTVDTVHGPIVPAEDIRALSEAERFDLETFRDAFIRRATPIREYRRWPVKWRRVPTFTGHVRRRLTVDRDNEYLRPLTLLRENIVESVRSRAVRVLYERVDSRRPFVYFPLHVTDDYKILKVIPHCADQVSLAEQVAAALPVGYDLVLKEHPMSVGRNPVRLLRRLRRIRNVRLVCPEESTHELIRKAEAVVVISSTVGLEALLYNKPVLTLGQPFYAGYGVTLDVDSFRELRESVPAVLGFRPEPERVSRFLHAAMRACSRGAPVLVDRSPENAIALAGSIERRAKEVIAERSAVPV